MSFNVFPNSGTNQPNIISSVGITQKPTNVFISSDTEPTTRDNGGDLVQGDVWWSETLNKSYYWVDDSWNLSTGTEGSLSSGSNISLLTNDVPYLSTSSSISELGDVSLGSVQDGNFLRYNGTNWINTDIVLSDIPDISSLYATAAQGTKADSALQSTDIGVSIQEYNANTVIDSSYVHTDNNFTNAEKTKLSGISDQAQSDFNETDSSSDAFIKNKPTLGTSAATDADDYATADQGTKADSALQSSDIGVTVQGYDVNTVIDSSYVRTDNNFTTTLKNKLDGVANNAEVNVQSDFNATSGDALILNKPTQLSDFNNNVGFITDITGGTLGQLSDVNLINISSGDIIAWNGSSWVNGSAPPADISGSSIDALNDVDTSTNPPNPGQALIWNSVNGEWVPGDVATDAPVDSVNGQTGTVVLNSDNIGEGLTNKYTTQSDIDKLEGIEIGAEANVRSNYNETDSTSDAFIQNKPTLGTAAATDSSEYATSEQGVKADSAIQPGDNISSLNNDAGFVTSAEAGGVTSVNGEVGIVVLDKGDIGLGNVNNTSDASKPISNDTQTALDLKADLVGGLIPDSQLPDSVKTQYLGVVNTEAEMLALSGQKGDWCLRTDKNISYVIVGLDPTSVSSWQSLTIGGSAVTSVNGDIGVVEVTTASINAATSDQGSKADSALQASSIGTTVQGYDANTVIDPSYTHTDENFTTNEKTKLSGVATGAEVNVQSNFNETDAANDAFIKNKPTLGTAAATDVGDYATASQGTKADSAVQPADNISTLTNNSGFISDVTNDDIEDLKDVSVTNVSNGDILSYNGAAWVNTQAPPADISGSSVGQLSDVDTSTTAPVTGQALVWNGSDGEWQPGDVAADAPVDSVNSQTGAVVLDSDDIDDSTSSTHKYVSSSQILLIDAAVQPGDNISDLTNDSNFITSSGAPVQTVNGASGTVVLDSDDIDDAGKSHKFVTSTQVNLINTALQPNGDVSDLTNDSGYLVNINSLSVNELSDVDTTTASPTSGQALVWNNTNWVPGDVAPDAPVDSVNTQTGAVVLDADDISDSSTTNKFVTSAQITSIGTALQPSDNISELTNNSGFISDVTNDDIEDLKDVTVSNVQVGDIIAWSGSAWVNGSAPPADISGSSINALNDVDTSTNPPSDGQVLAWNNTNGEWVPGSAGQTPPVDSVNGEIGVVVLDADDIDDSSTTHKFATTDQLTKADSATQPGDNISTLTNDSGFITTSTANVISVNGASGTVVLDSDDVSQGSSNLYSQWATSGSNINYTAGSVGVGVSSSTYPLEVSDNIRVASTSGNANLRLQSKDDGLARIFFGETSSSNNSYIAYNNLDGSLKFNNSDSESFRVNSGGYFGIGLSTNTTYPLEVKGNVNFQGDLTLTGSVDGRDVSVDGTKLDTVDTNANYITNNNQLSNGSNFITSAGAPVQTVNGASGTVVLDPDDLDDASTTHKFVSSAQITSIGTAIQPGDNVSALTNDSGFITASTANVISVNTQSGTVVLDADDIDDTSTTHKFATASQLTKADSALQSGDNISELTNNSNFITSAGAPVQTVNGASGTVVLDADDIDDTSTTHKFATATQLSKSDSSLQPGDIGVTVQGYDVNTVVDVSYVHTDNNFSTTEKNKLGGIATGAEVNVQSDFSATTGDSFIKNKPTNLSDFTNDLGFVSSSGNTIIGTDDDYTGTNANVLSGLTLTDGVVTAFASRNLTLANLGYTGATDANKITDNNQIGNGAGYITSADGGNAGSLNGATSSQYLRSDTADRKTSGTLGFDDSVILAFGSGDDAEFFTNGTHLYLDLNSGIGNFYIRDGSTTRFTFDDVGDFTATGTVSANALSGDGSLLTSLNASNLSSGTVSDDRLPATISSNITGSSASCTGNAATATTASSCSGNSATATTSSSCSGNSATATKLATSRTISLTGDVTGSTSFDGSGNASITATVADDSHNHTIANVDGLQTALDGKQASGTYNTVIGTDSDISTSGATVIETLTMTDGVIGSHSTRSMTLGDLGYTGATDANKITDNNQIGNGAGYITSSDDITGNSSTATKLATARTISLTGDVTGSTTFDGSGNKSITCTVADDSHNHTIANVDGLQTALDGKLGTSGKAADSEKLDNLNSTQFLRSDASGTLTGSLTVTGNVNSQSDVRLKNNIRPLENTLEQVNKLRGVKYDRIDIKSNDVIGVIAQEVEEIYPEFVHTDDEGIKSVDYSKMVAVLIESVKELTEKVNQLENK